MKWILASGSPRRREILEMLGVPFSVVTADVDETCSLSDPAETVKELAHRKAKAVADRLGYPAETLIIAADTLVAIDGTVLGKPRDRDDARRMIQQLSGRTHAVYSGVSLIRGKQTLTEFEKTEVTFGAMTERDIERYLNTGEPFDKAGGYAVQGKAAVFIEKINGCYFNVVGLPVHRIRLMLNKMGII